MCAYCEIRQADQSLHILMHGSWYVFCHPDCRRRWMQEEYHTRQAWSEASKTVARPSLAYDNGSSVATLGLCSIKPPTRKWQRYSYIYGATCLSCGVGGLPPSGMASS